MLLPTVWVIGDWREPVFYEAVEWIQSHANCQCFDALPTVCDREQHSRDDRVPQTIVLAQARPGRFQAAQIEQLHCLEPLARLVALTGPWCEGEERSGRPIPGVIRVAWRNWREQLPPALRQVNAEAFPLRTATATDRIERSIKAVADERARQGTVLICTERLADYDPIADAVQQLGMTPMSGRTVDSDGVTPDAIIFAGWQAYSAFNNDTGRIHDAQQALRILSLQFPRPEDHVAAQKAGIDVVIGQPLRLADLHAALATERSHAA